jgi:hypothetical protein
VTAFAIYNRHSYRRIGKRLIAFGSMKPVLAKLHSLLRVLPLFVGFGAIIGLGTGCSTTAVRSDFLSGTEQLHKGRYVESYWSAPNFTKESLARIYLAPIDTSRIQDAPGITASAASDCLKLATISNIRSPGGWSVTEQQETATATLALAITYLTPGSVAGRFWAAELGAGHAFVQVEGKLTDTSTEKEIARFADRRRDSGSIGFEDLGGNAGPRLVKRMLEAISSDFIKELSATAGSQSALHK